MKLAVRRVDSDGRYVTLIARDDGVTFSMQGVGHNFAIPHDVAHYVVEKALCLDGGFWGSVSEGAVFPTMTYVAGRRKPKAVERSSLILGANAQQLSEAEVLVRIFNDTIEQGHSETSSILHGRLKERRASSPQGPPNIGQVQISEVFATYNDVLSKWKNTSVGGKLELHWRSSRAQRKRG
jgi:hypothetical protein